MTDSVTIELSPEARANIERAAQANGQTPEAFIAEAAAKRARALSEARAFFATRAQRADLAAFDAIMNRKGGQPPEPDDLIN